MKKKKYLIIASHPDDETLGCGATIYNLRKEKKNVRVIFLGEGSTCRFKSDTKKKILDKVIEQRKKYSINALKILKIKDYFYYNLPCGKFDQVPILKIGKIIEKEISKFKPNVILTHSDIDVHIDHQRTFQAVLQATRPSSNNNVEMLLSFEILSATEKNFTKEFLPNYFIQINQNSLEKKLKAMKCYKSEIAKHPFSRSLVNIKNLAMYRGSQSGNYFAEAFKIIRLIEKKR